MFSLFSCIHEESQCCWSLIPPRRAVFVVLDVTLICEPSSDEIIYWPFFFLVLEPLIQLMSHLMDSDQWSQTLHPESATSMGTIDIEKTFVCHSRRTPLSPTHPVQIDKVKHEGQILSSIDLSKHSLTVMSPQYKCNAPTVANEEGGDLLSSYFAVNDISYVLSIFLPSFTHLFCDLLCPPFLRSHTLSLSTTLFLALLLFFSLPGEWCTP